jgi:hypothetical protein
MNTSSRWNWKSLAAGAVLLGASLGAQAADKIETAGSNKYERIAIQVVLDWTAAFAAKDKAKIASYMDDDAEFRLDPTEREFKSGKAALATTLDMILRSVVGVKTRRVYAIGDAKEVLVIVDRVDDFDFGNGKKTVVPLGAFYRVNPQTRKIEEWLDAPLVKIDLPAPPPGGAPGRNGGPGPAGPAGPK